MRKGQDLQLVSLGAAPLVVGGSGGAMLAGATASATFRC